MNKRRVTLAIVIVTLAVFSVFTALVVAQDETPLEDPAALLEARQVQVLPLEAVTESGPQVLDLASDSARINFIGTIPLACTVLFGTDTTFGRASVDQNMEGAAMIDHNPLLLDLQPDTEYFYRLQGSGEDGTFYVSEIYAFRTPPESEEVTENLLSPERGAQIIGLSSNFGNQDNDGNWGILNAFDGNGNTAWSSNGDGDDAWFEVELAERSRITSVEFWSRLMTDGTSQILEFTITTDDGTVYGPFTLPDADQAYEFDVEIIAKTLRFDVVSSTGGNTGAMEIAVYGEPVTE